MKNYKGVNMKNYNGELKKVDNDLLTTDYTYIESDEITFNSPHKYFIKSAHDIILGSIHFQEGPLKESGLNGVFNEDLIGIVIDRLEHFQNSDFSCRENAVAITKLEEALMWLRKRTLNRQKRNVLGTYSK
jgi:hypothetical protein